MTKRTKALSGASQDAYFRRLLKAQPGLTAEEREKLVQRLRQEIAQLRLRRQRRAVGEAATEPSLPRSASPPQPPAVVTAQPDGPAAPVAAPFDPFSINVVVLLRKAGREGALGALEAIESVDNLRLLAREQRLSVGADLASPAELRAAIVHAAERRIANRIAAAS